MHPSVTKAREVLARTNERIAATAEESAERAERLRLERAAAPPRPLVTTSMADVDDDYQGRSRERWIRSQGLHHRPAAPAATTPTMTPAEQARWDMWLRNNIHNAIYKNNEVWRKAIITVIRDLRREWAAELDCVVSHLDGEKADQIRKLIGQLRHDVVEKARGR